MPHVAPSHRNRFDFLLFYMSFPFRFLPSRASAMKLDDSLGVLDMRPFRFPIDSLRSRLEAKTLVERVSLHS
jgi:hypothetical protein